MSTEEPISTEGAEYTERLARLSGSRLKQILDVQRPYRWNLRRLRLGRVLDLGCGLGRNLANLEGNGVGVDHNPTSVAHARSLGFAAFTPAEFQASEHARPGAFDSLLLSHVAEHLDEDACLGLLRAYLPYLTPVGRVVVITPQERGYGSDASHVRFVGEAELAQLARDLGVRAGPARSFPLPRRFGRVFVYNELVLDVRGARI